MPYVLCVLGLSWLLGNGAHLFFFSSWICLLLPVKTAGMWVRIHQRMSCRGEGFTVRNSPLYDQWVWTRKAGEASTSTSHGS